MAKKMGVDVVLDYRKVDVVSALRAAGLHALQPVVRLSARLERIDDHYVWRQ